MRTEISAANIQAMAQEVWSPIFQQELREKTMMAGLVNKDYSGEIRKGGDTVKVSQINAPQGSLLDVGVDADSFSSEAIDTTTIDVKADKRAVAAYDIEDLVMLQTQLGQKDSEIRESLLFSIKKQINDFLYSLVAPSAANTVVAANLTATVLKDVRVKAGQAKWMRNKPWWLLADPLYHGDMLDASQLISSDFVGDRAVEVGQITKTRYGFNAMEDDSRGEGGVKEALAFHPDWLLLVQQTQPTFKLSDKHPNSEFGFLLSVDVVFGAKLGIDGENKHITIRTV